LDGAVEVAEEVGGWLGVVVEGFDELVHFVGGAGVVCGRRRRGLGAVVEALAAGESQEGAASPQQWSRWSCCHEVSLGVRRATSSMTACGTSGGTSKPTSVNDASNWSAAVPSAMYRGQSPSAMSFGP
jgi:hypothetical protein